MAHLDQTELADKEQARREAEAHADLIETEARKFHAWATGHDVPLTFSYKRRHRWNKADGRWLFAIGEKTDDDDAALAVYMDREGQLYGPWGMRPITAENRADKLRPVTIDAVERGIARVVHDSGIPYT
jgi:hypothetical protein